MERKTGFEPATTTLARWGSTGLSYFRSQERGAILGGSPVRVKTLVASLTPFETLPYRPAPFHPRAFPSLAVWENIA